MRIVLAIFLILLSHPGQTRGAETSAVVSSVVDGDTLTLEDGRVIRLVGLQAPKISLGRTGFTPWPMGEEAKEALQRLTLGETLTLSYGGATMDRHGRLLAHLHLSDGRWVQGEMLKKGMARVYSFPDNRSLVSQMLALEKQARLEARGIWVAPFYQVKSPLDMEGMNGTFQIVEGTVVSAAVVRGRGYLNFGEDYRTDFTVSISPKSRRLFEKAGIEIEALEGKRVRARGWITSFNGPAIEATHPEQVEILEMKEEE